MFDIFGENHLTRINTSAGAEDIAAFKNSYKTKSVQSVYLSKMMTKAFRTLKQSKRRHGKKKTTMMVH